MATSHDNEEIAELMKKPGWYSKAQEYWENIDPTVDGVLGGFEQVDPIDVKGSLLFVDEFVNGVVLTKPPLISKDCACDCGAGIGRVTKNFLLKIPFSKVDMVEQAPKFVQEAKDTYLREEILSGAVSVQCQGLQDFAPSKGKYDLIWCQWVLGHLTDDHLVAFFQRCIAGLKPGGLIGVKENNASKGNLVDDEDSSVTRTDAALKHIFEKAGLGVIKEDIQRGLPAGLFTVRMYMLRPISSE